MKTQFHLGVVSSTAEYAEIAERRKNLKNSVLSTSSTVKIT